VSIFLYTPYKSMIHRLDPRAKIFCLILFFALGLVFNNPLYLLPILILTLMIAWLGNSLKNLWNLRYIFLILIAFSTILWPFFIRGPTELFSFWRIHFTLESILYGFAMGIRTAIFLITGVTFLSTTRIEEFTTALIKLKIPYPVAFSISTAFRLLPAFVGAGSTIIQAQTSRGLNLESGNIVVRMKKFIPLLVPILIYAIRSINLQAMALESKCFNLTKDRTFYFKLKMKNSDYVIIFILFCVCLITLYLRISGYGVVLPRL